MTLVTLLHDAGLCGRGGAAFPTAVKLEAALAHRAHLVVNACDGEVGAAKDGWVVAHHLDDLARGAELLSPRRASTVRYAAHRGSATASRLRAAGLDVLEVPPRYVSSEETSLVSLTNGGLARPMTRRAPFVGGGRDAGGRRIRPTLVLNAETVWRVAQLAERGGDWFRAHGTPEEPGPRLVTVNLPTAPGVVLDTEAGVPVTQLLSAAAGGPRALPSRPALRQWGGLPDEVDAILVGGLSGGFVPARAVAGLRWSTRDLAQFGLGVGPGVVTVPAAGECPVALVDRFLAYAAGESSGQCGPCMFGLPALAADWRAFLRGPSPALLHGISRRVGLLPGRGACRFPDGVGRFVASALRVHRDHLEGHVAGRCPEPRGRRADVLPR